MSPAQKKPDAVFPTPVIKGVVYQNQAFVEFNFNLDFKEGNVALIFVQPEGKQKYFKMKGDMEFEVNSIQEGITNETAMQSFQNQQYQLIFDIDLHVAIDRTIAKAYYDENELTQQLSDYRQELEQNLAQELFQMQQQYTQQQIQQQEQQKRNEIEQQLYNMKLRGIQNGLNHIDLN